MASVKISELTKFSYEFVQDNAEHLLIPTSNGDVQTGSINVKVLVDDVISQSEHEKEQELKLQNHQTQINIHQTKLETQQTQINTNAEKIADVENTLENIDVWDLETFHD